MIDLSSLSAKAVKPDLAPPPVAENPAQQPFHILINGSSGAASRIGRDRLQSMADTTSLKIESFDILPTDEFFPRLDELSRKDEPLLVGGGDGSIAKTAGLFLERQSGHAFGILPMGTMNLLAKDLGIPLMDTDDNPFDYYAKTQVRAIDVGMINGHPFLCAAAIGTMPEAAVFRENMRELPDLLLVPRLTAYILDQMGHENMRAIDLVADGREMALNTASLVISNNRFARAHEASHKLAKSSLQDGMLGIYSAEPQTLFERMRLLMRLGQGKIDVEPSVYEYQARSVSIKTENAEELVSIDGEPVTLSTPLHVHILDGALKIITPVMVETEEV